MSFNDVKWKLTICLHIMELETEQDEKSLKILSLFWQVSKYL